MKHKHYRTKYEPLLIDAEINNMASKTIPDQSMSITEMLTRNAHGMPLNAKIPYYNGDEVMPDLKKMDISEVHAIVSQNRQKIKEINDAINQRKEAAALHRLTEQIKAAEQAKKDKLAQFQQLKSELYPDASSEQH